MLKLFTSLFFLFSFCFSQATTVSGTVTDEQGNAVPYVNVYIKELYKGASTNTAGFYSIHVQPGSYTLVFKFLGYKTETRNIVLTDEPLQVNCTLHPEKFELGTVTISAGAEDPAYAIMRNAIRKRKYYLEEVNAYACNVYIKGVQRLTSYPEKFLGQKLNFGAYVDSVTGIFYLSESVSKFKYQKPNKINEEMISSRISGNSKAFSYNQASDMMFNFYENTIKAKQIGERGFISPVAGSAMFYYRYKLLGSSIENDVLVHKIELTPRRQHDPVFRGVIYIADSTWRIHNMDVLLVRDAGLEFVDTLQIRQTYLPVDTKNDIWMPVSNRFDFTFRFLGFKGGGDYVGYFSDFEINPAFAKRTFTSEILKVNDDANSKDSSYWTLIRPIPLTLEEKTDYSKKDSLQIVRESKQFNDSLDSITNKFSLSGYILNGYTRQNRFKKSVLRFSSLLENVQYNTVEGWHASLGVQYTRRFENRKRVWINANARYGFSNKHFNAWAGGSYRYHQKNGGRVGLRLGTEVKQINEDDPVSPLINTFYTLLDAKNYLKIFEKQFVRFETSRELFNGLFAEVNSEFAHRIPLRNTSFLRWNNKSSREFSSNNPFAVSDTVMAFEQHNALAATLDVKYNIAQKYISRPDAKFIEESRFPQLTASVTHAFLVDARYTKLSAGFNHKIKLGMAGELFYQARYAWFANTKKIFAPDMQHFKGNQTFFSSFPSDGFNVLAYYNYSTVKPSLAVHAEHHFQKFITNKIPLFRKLKLDEVIGFHYLHVNGLPEHFEFSAGFERLGLLRVDYVQSFTGSKKPVHAIRFGLKIGG